MGQINHVLIVQLETKNKNNNNNNIGRDVNAQAATCKRWSNVRVNSLFMCLFHLSIH